MRYWPGMTPTEVSLLTGTQVLQLVRATDETIAAERRAEQEAKRG
jgi:hypothetical protein